jgi:crotonobetainyl-CoA:carnitine CoA-transferase CaiB-like acyl-CoA transferase
LSACAGIRVLEIGEGFSVGALCGQLFAGLGASVNVVEPPSGSPLRHVGSQARDGSSYLFHLLNAGKQAVSIDIHSASESARLRKLIDEADVVLIDGRGRDLLETLGREASFTSQWPRGIICVISLCGRRSSRGNWVGNELIAEAGSALMSCTGYPDRPPVSSGLPYVLHTAALFAFNATMAALWERDRSGLGQSIDLAILDCQIALLGNFMPSYFISGRSPRRIGNRHTIAAPWNLYPALDGNVMICTGTGGAGWWAKILSVIDRPELLRDPRYATEADRVKNVDEVDEIVSAWTRTRKMDDVVRLMSANAVPASEVSTIEAVLADPHFKDLRAMVLKSALVSQDSASSLPVAGLPFKIGGLVSEEAKGACSAPDGPRLLEPRGQGNLSGIGPLAGIRVIEFGSRTSAPLAARFLADLGAEVVKIEPRKGESLRMAGQQIGGSSYLFQINNAGKRSVVIEPTDPKGRKLILELAAHADIWIENLAPGSVDSMGLGYEDVRAANPHVIYCSVSGFGIRSNYGSKRALDTVVQAASGLMYMTGYPDHFPVKLGTSAIDLTTATAVVAAILASLRRRILNGEGLHVDLAMADIGVWMTQKVWPEIFCDGRHPKRKGNGSSTDCPHGIFSALGEKYVAIAVETDSQWRDLVQILDRAELRESGLEGAAGRLQQSDRIERIISEWTSDKRPEDIAGTLQSYGVPAAPVRDLAELAVDPDVVSRGLILQVDHPVAGSVRLLGNPMSLSRTPPLIAAAAPVLGEHTEEILKHWLNMSDTQMGQLRAAGTIVPQEHRPS